jgi:hypothetical protein
VTIFTRVAVALRISQSYLEGHAGVKAQGLQPAYFGSVLLALSFQWWLDARLNASIGPEGLGPQSQGGGEWRGVQDRNL